MSIQQKCYLSNHLRGLSTRHSSSNG